MLSLRRLDSDQHDFDTELAALTHWDIASDPQIMARARAIVDDVRSRGDAAVLEYTRRFDGIAAPSVAALEVEAGELQACLEGLPRSERDALEYAAGRIRTYHEHQIGVGFTIEDEFGNRLGSRLTALDRVGVYVPGGQAAYPSSVLMTVVPARVAGVGEIVVTVPTPRGDRQSIVLAALAIAGVDRVLTIGGAQAIAALAYGTESIQRVDKIVGPGGAYVAAAKQLVFGPVGIDSIAGPSEIVVVADGSAPANWVALDLFSQAEHDASAQAILLCPDAAYIDRVAVELEAELGSMPRAEVIRASIERRGALIRTRDLADAIGIANRIAPEHLQLAVRDPEALLPTVKHAGAIFLGARAAETFGDYVAGPSHVLPTFGTARFASPLGVYDFQKRSSIIAISARGAAALAASAATMARGEGLYAHARAAEARNTGDAGENEPR